jgi:ATP phosphoribosyltransferase
VSSRPLTIALPKGRTLGPVAELFTRAGVDLGDALREDSRALVRRGTFGAHALDLLLLKSDDVPTYVEHGTADLGICGRDILLERDADVYQPIDLGIGRCRLVVAGKVEGDAKDRGLRMPRVATKYPRIAEAHFVRKGVQVEIVNVQSSVELAPLTGLADLIVDLVETGTTLAENGLEVKEEIVRVSTLLIANRASYKLRQEAIGPLVSALRGSVSIRPT